MPQPRTDAEHEEEDELRGEGDGDLQQCAQAQPAQCGLRASFWSIFRPLSSWRGPQTALNRSYRSDRVTRG